MGSVPVSVDAISSLDKRVLSEIQARLPVDPAPWTVLGERLGVRPADVRESVARLRETGVIRRIGAIFDSHRLGYASTLCAMAAPPERIEECAAHIGCYPNVTHNYEREDRYNVWFTLIARPRERIGEILDEIAETTRVTDILDLPALRLFKIRVDFDLTGEREVDGEVPSVTVPAEVVPIRPTSEERALIRALQDDLPAGARPFAHVAGRLAEQGCDVDESWVVDRTRDWVSAGVIRRFGAAIRHHATGFTANAMGVWDCPPERIEDAGRTMAGFAEVSHCYQRPNVPSWPHDLYTMIHGRSREECEDVAARIREATGLPDARLLYSVREFKKTSMRYFAEEA